MRLGDKKSQLLDKQWFQYSPYVHIGVSNGKLMSLMLRSAPVVGCAHLTLPPAGCGPLPVPRQTMVFIFVVLVIFTVLCFFAHDAAWGFLQFLCDDENLARLRIEWRAVHCDLNGGVWGCAGAVPLELQATCTQKMIKTVTDLDKCAEAIRANPAA